MKKLCGDLIEIIEKYDEYYNGDILINDIKEQFEKVKNKLNNFFEDNGYLIEYNKIEGKPNKPFIPLFTIRDPLISPYMTEGIYVVLLIKRNEGVYISLNQGTENKNITYIKSITEKYRRRVNDIIASYNIQYNSGIPIDNINITDNIKGNLKRPKSYEEGNIKALFYDINELKSNPEKFLRDIIWFMELYRLIL